MEMGNRQMTGSVLGVYLDQRFSSGPFWGLNVAYIWQDARRD